MWAVSTASTVRWRAMRSEATWAPFLIEERTKPATKRRARMAATTSKPMVARVAVSGARPAAARPPEPTQLQSHTAATASAASSANHGSCVTLEAASLRGCRGQQQRADKTRPTDHAPGKADGRHRNQRLDEVTTLPEQPFQEAERARRPPA